MGKHPLKGVWPAAHDSEQIRLEEFENRFLDEFWFAGEAQKKGLTAGDVDPYELGIGTKVEMEHTDAPEIAAKITLDHLAEHPDYYHGLSFMETLLETGALYDAIEIVREHLGLGL